MNDSDNKAERFQSRLYHSPDYVNKHTSDEGLHWRHAWRQREREIEARFKRESLETLELDKHPKADLLFQLAWDYADKNMLDAWYEMNRLAQLLR